MLGYMPAYIRTFGIYVYYYCGLLHRGTEHVCCIQCETVYICWQDCKLLGPLAGYCEHNGNHCLLCTYMYVSLHFGSI